MAALSSRHARARALASTSRSPSVGSSSASSRSTVSRSSTDRQAVSRQAMDARHSLTRPALRCAKVRGISPTSACASPKWRDPRWGDSRRARATWAPRPRLRSRAGTPAASRLLRWESAKATLTRACAPAAAALIDSRRPSWSIRSASGTPTSRDGNRSRRATSSAVVRGSGTSRVGVFTASSVALIVPRRTSARTGVRIVSRRHRHHNGGRARAAEAATRHTVRSSPDRRTPCAATPATTRRGSSGRSTHRSRRGGPWPGPRRR